MNMFYAFVSEEYYEAWATEEIESDRKPTQVRFVQTFGTPHLYFHEKEDSIWKHYIIINQEDKPCINYNYYPELRLRYPNVVHVVDQPEVFGFMKQIRDFFSGVFANSKRSAVAPIGS